MTGDAPRATFGRDRGDPFVDLAPLAALGALDGRERRAFESHARACPLCRDERRAFERIAGWLPLALPPVRPSLGVRARVLRVAAALASDQRGHVSKLARHGSV